MRFHGAKYSDEHRNCGELFAVHGRRPVVVQNGPSQQQNDTDREENSDTQRGIFKQNYRKQLKVIVSNTVPEILGCIDGPKRSLRWRRSRVGFNAHQAGGRDRRNANAR